MLVHLDAREVADARALAEATHAKWKTTQGHYRNLSRSHLVGKVGEVAAEKWASQNCVLLEARFRDFEREGDADLLLGQRIRTLRVDVKTWSSEYWGQWGRCVAVGQLAALRRKADSILWAYACDLSERAASVYLAGWSTLAEVEAMAPVWTGPNGREVHNHQVAENQLRGLDELLADLREE
jgi:hypothetical protein